MCKECTRIAAMKYERILSTEEVEGVGMCQTYKVVGKDETNKVVVDIPDISPHAEVADRLVDLLNRCEVSRYHAKEVVEDFIAVL